MALVKRHGRTDNLERPKSIWKPQLWGTSCFYRKGEWSERNRFLPPSHRPVSHKGQKEQEKKQEKGGGKEEELGVGGTENSVQIISATQILNTSLKQDWLSF